MEMLSALAPTRLRPVGHDAEMSAVDHLEELRTRLIVSLLAVAVAFGVCFWQNHQILRLVNAPLAQKPQQQVRAGHGPLGATYLVQQNARNVARQLAIVVGVLHSTSLSPAAQAKLSDVQKSLDT